MKYYLKKIVNVKCKKCGWQQKVWNYKISQLRCSCGGRTLKDWEVIKDEKRNIKR